MKIRKLKINYLKAIFTKFIFIALLCTFSSCKEDEIYKIPNNYEGTVVVVFDSENGKPKIFSDNKRIYNINSKGILLTQFELNEKISSVKYYYVDNCGNIIKEIKYIDKLSIKNQDSIYVFSKSLATGLSNKNGKEYYYIHFLIGKAKDADSLYKIRDKQFLPDIFENN